MGALRDRVAQTQALLRGETTSLILVTAPEPRLTAETDALAHALARVGLRIDGVVVNRAPAQTVFGDGVAEPPLPAGWGRRSGPLRGFQDLQTSARRQRATLAPCSRPRAPRSSEVPLPRRRRRRSTSLTALGRRSSPSRRLRRRAVWRGDRSSGSNGSGGDGFRGRDRRTRCAARSLSTLRFKFVRLPCSTSSLVASLLTSAREGRLRSPSTVCMLRSMCPFVSSPAWTADISTCANRGFDSSSSASRCSLSLFRMARSSRPRRSGQYMNPMRGGKAA